VRTEPNRLVFWHGSLDFKVSILLGDGTNRAANTAKPSVGGNVPGRVLDSDIDICGQPLNVHLTRFFSMASLTFKHHQAFRKV
jgi:hypothetical protein